MMYDVIIAGAGPVGLSLALRLGREGKCVLVLEKNPTTHEHSRAPAIWPRTQEILAELGVIDQFLKRGIVLEQLTLRDAMTKEVILDLPFQEVSSQTNYPYMLILPQSQTEHLLCEAVLDTPGVDMHFSTELTSFTQQDSFVEVQYREDGVSDSAKAQYLIGCDGAHSTVRKVLGFHLQGETYSMEAALADVEVETDSLFPLFAFGEVLAVAIKIDTKLWRLILPHAKSEHLSLDERVEKAVQQFFPGKEYKRIWTSDFRLHNRISTSFVQGRVALAGDAAHLNSPVGGQGMNAGIQDTEILGKALLKALEKNDPSYLKQYERERKAAVSTGVNRFTDWMTQALLLRRGRFLRHILKGWNALLKIPFIRIRFLRRLAML